MAGAALELWRLLLYNIRARRHERRTAPDYDYVEVCLDKLDKL